MAKYTFPELKGLDVEFIVFVLACRESDFTDHTLAHPLNCRSVLACRDESGFDLFWKVVKEIRDFQESLQI